MRQNIFITGFSGTGKTTVSKEVASLLRWKFVDLDDEIERASGTSIEAIFADKSEGHFRQLEQDQLVIACKSEKQIVSTGGGIIMDEGNRGIMEQNGIIVCLEARPSTILQRLEIQSEESPVSRPMLSAPDALERIISLKSERQFNYTQAHWTVHTDALTPAEAADEVVRAWKVLSKKCH